MSKVRTNWWSRTPVIAGAFFSMIAVGASFGGVQARLGTELLDMQFDGVEARVLLNALDAEQRSLHFWATLLLDSLYPLAYGAFFAGLVWRLSGGRIWFLLPIAIGVSSDFAENFVQLLALRGSVDLLDAKGVLTPLKFGGTALSALLVILLLAVLLLRRFGQGKGSAGAADPVE